MPRGQVGIAENRNEGRGGKMGMESQNDVTLSGVVEGYLTLPFFSPENFKVQGENYHFLRALPKIRLIVYYSCNLYCRVS